jgi:hypothetical protein
MPKAERNATTPSLCRTLAALQVLDLDPKSGDRAALVECRARRDHRGERRPCPRLPPRQPVTECSHPL